MKNSSKNLASYLFYVLLSIELLLVLSISSHGHSNITFANESLYSLNDDWSYHDSEENNVFVTLPVNLNVGDSNSVLITRTLPFNYQRITSIGILTTHQSISAYINGEEIYSRDIHTDRERFFNVPIGSIWDIIPLPPHSEGKILTLVFTSKYNDYAGRINEIHTGTNASILIHNIDLFGFGFVLSIIITLLGVFILFLYPFIKRLLGESNSIYYLGWFSLIAGIWLLMESNLSQLFISNAYLISTFSYITLMTFPIPILFYINSLGGYHFKKLNTIIICVFIGSDLLFLFLQFFNIMDFHEAQPWVLLETTLLLSSILLTLWLDFLHYKNNVNKVFTISITILFLFSIMELISYRFQSELITRGFFRIGFCIFIFVMAWDTVRRIVEVIKLSKTATHYKLLATRDPLTNCRSRVAYHKDIERIDLSKHVTLFMADMNNMKDINDNFGHQVGDEVIILCSQCLLKVFGRRVYRIGGDEFFCIEYYMSDMDIENILVAFKNEYTKANEDIPYKFEMSVGYATFDKTIDKNIHDTIKRADTKMYEIKETMKEQTKQKTDAIKRQVAKKPTTKKVGSPKE